MAAKPTSPPPAYFLSLSLENVRSFGEKQTISFAREDGRPAQWTIILGDNGVGKTTVLKSLAAVGIDFSKELFPDDEFRDPKFDYDWQVKWWPIRSDEYTTLINYKAYLGDLRHAKAPSHESENAIQILGKNEELKKRYHLRVESIPKVLWGLFCYGYGAGRSVNDTAIGENFIDNDISASLFNEHASLLNLEELFLQLDYSSKILADNKRLLMQRDLVKETLLLILPDIEDLRISSLGTLQKPQITLQFKTLYGWVRLRDMSLGYQTTIAWVTDLANKLFIRYPNSSNPLEEPAIVLIDEIDLHLHPSWQRKLIGFLSDIFKNTQFIATAHSPLVVQAASDANANVVLLKREGDQTIVSQNPVDVRGWRVDQILTSAFFNLETARSVETEKKMTRQATLLNKEKLSAKERRELDALTLELEGQPMGSVGGEDEEAEILRELMARLNQTPS